MRAGTGGDEASLFCDELLMLNKIAHVIRKKRFKEGSINFDTVEPKFQLDAEGHPIGIVIKERKDAHLLIEDYLSTLQVVSMARSGLYHENEIL
ncbi:MAG: hypothetical protein RIS64_4256 [Bacteroidota bacterium]